MAKVMPKTGLMFLLVCTLAGLSNSRYIKGPRTMELIGNATYGFYCVHLYFGPKMQKECLIIDTGSTATIIPCSGCSNYGPNHFNEMYRTEDSPYFEADINSINNFDWQCPPSNKDCQFSKVCTCSNSGLRGGQFLHRQLRSRPDDVSRRSRQFPSDSH